MRELYLFRSDLRLNDNPGLLEHSQGDKLLCVYCMPVGVPWCNVSGRGKHRVRFLRETVGALQFELQKLGQELLVLDADPRSAIPKLVSAFQIDRVGVGGASGWYESEQVKGLERRLEVPLLRHENTRLLGEEQLPGGLAMLSSQFTPFRRAVEALPWPAPAPPPESLPAPPDQVPFEAPIKSSEQPHPEFPLRGGSKHAHQRLQQWLFQDKGARDYKATRNALGDLSGSSLLSPHFASGALSVREAASALSSLETKEGANESTRHLFFEFLWREFFQWRALVDGAALFHPGGRKRKNLLKTFDARSFARFCQGETNCALVNALMHQLTSSGWMSNRGRQIAASYLINELNHDWRYGAAFFEKHLVDYDVASNYGNWQYIAGVGTDPRGGRHFNVEKQRAQYDPEGVFIKRWDGERSHQPLYAVDAADWPIS